MKIIEDIYAYNIDTKEAVKSLVALIAQVERQTAAVKAAARGTDEYKSASAALAQSTKLLGEQLSQGATTIEQLRTKIAALRGGMESATIGSKEFKAAQGELIKTEKQLAEAIGQTGAAAQGSTTLFSGLRGATALVAAGAAAVGTALVAAGIKSIQAASQVGDFRTALETMLGSKTAAVKVEKEITAIAAKSPFELSEVQTLTKQLIAYGFSAREIAPTITQLGNISAGVGKDKLPQLTLAFGQVKAAGKLFGSELRQFTEAGVPLLAMLSEQSGKSAGQIRADMERGVAPSFKEVQAAIAAAAGEGGKFGGLMEKMSQNTSGLWSNMLDGVFQLSAAIGERLTSGANGAIAGINGLVSSLVDFVRVSDVEKLQQEQIELNGLAAAIVTAANSQEVRNAAIGELQQKYPTFFASLNKEIDLNAAIAMQLKEVNELYRLRIEAAAAAQFADEKSKVATDIALKRLQYQKQLNAELGLTVADTGGLDEAALKALYIKKARELTKLDISEATLDVAGSGSGLTAVGNRFLASFGLSTIETRIALATRDLDKATKEAADAARAADAAKGETQKARLDKFDSDLRAKQVELQSAEEDLIFAQGGKDEAQIAAAVKRREQVNKDIRQLQKDRNELLGISFERTEEVYDKNAEKAAADAAKKRKKAIQDVERAIREAVADLDKALQDALRDIQKRAVDAESGVAKSYNAEAVTNIEQVRARFEAMVKANEETSEAAVKALKGGTFRGESLYSKDDKGVSFIDVSKVREAAGKIKDEFKTYLADQKAAATESIKELSSFFAEAAKTDERLIDAEIAAIQDANARKVAEIERGAAKTQAAFDAANAKIQGLLQKGLITQSQADREMLKNNEAAAAARFQADVQLYEQLLKELQDYYKDREAIQRQATHDEQTIYQTGVAGLKQAAADRYLSGITSRQKYESEIKAIDDAAKIAELERTKAQAQALILLEEEKQAELAGQRQERADRGIETQSIDAATSASVSRVLDLKRVIAEATVDIADVKVKVNETELEKTTERIKRFLSLAKAASEAVLGAMSKVAAEQAQQIDAAIGRSQARLNDLVSDQKTSNAKQVAIERERLEKLEAERRKAAERQREIAIIQVVTSSLVAIAEAAAAGAATGTAPFTIAATLIALGAGLAAARAGAENAFYDGTDFVPLGKNPKGRDTIPARLHEGEAVVQADKNAQYHATVKAIRRGEIDPIVLNTFVERNKKGRQSLAHRVIDLESVNTQVGVAMAFEFKKQEESVLELQALRREFKDLSRAIKDKPDVAVSVNASAQGVFNVVRRQQSRFGESKNIGRV